MTELSGLDPTFVRRSGGRLETQAYLREVYRTEGKLGSRYDSNVTAVGSVPVRARSSAPTIRCSTRSSRRRRRRWSTSSRTPSAGNTTGRYNALSYEVNRAVGAARTR